MNTLAWLSVVCPAITVTLAALDWADQHWPPHHGRHERQDGAR